VGAIVSGANTLAPQLVSFVIRLGHLCYEYVALRGGVCAGVTCVARWRIWVPHVVHTLVPTCGSTAEQDGTLRRLFSASPEVREVWSWVQRQGGVVLDLPIDAGSGGGGASAGPGDSAPAKAKYPPQSTMQDLVQGMQGWVKEHFKGKYVGGHQGHTAPAAHSPPPPNAAGTVAMYARRFLGSA
jgi:hypothetical protein